MDYSTRLKSNYVLVAAIILMFLSGFSGSDNSKDIQDCANSLTGLATCLPYVGGTAKSPTPDCCNGLKQVLKTNKTCLCVIIKDRNDPQLGLNINATLALGLPDVCNAPANISQCPALLKLPPNSPDAQVFYQLGKNVSSAGSSPVAGGPKPSAVPTTSPAGATASGQKNGGCGKAKSKERLVAEILLVALLLLSTLFV